MSEQKDLGHNWGNQIIYRQNSWDFNRYWLNLCTVCGVGKKNLIPSDHPDHDKSGVVGPYSPWDEVSTC
jgi:hypothetical protein